MDFSQLSKVYIETPLGKKLAQAKITAKSLVQISGTSNADVSHYLHRRFHKIGKARRRQIRKVLNELGIVRRRTRKPSRCKNCGVAYPTWRGVPKESDVSHYGV